MTLPRRRATLGILALILIAAGAATLLAMRRTSTTFDEIVLIAGGVRGHATGQWDIAPEHPPLTQYLYGILPHFTGPMLAPERSLDMSRYYYAQLLFYEAGNDPERLAFLGRLPAVLCVLLLILLVFGYVRSRYGDGAALLAAAITAFMPDILGHGGVAYNDVPVTTAMFGAIWLADRATRAPTLARGLAFGIAAGIAVGTKNSAVMLAPVAFALLTLEALHRRGDADWGRRALVAAAVAIVALYLTLVLVVYRGDFTLAEYRYSLGFVFNQVSEGGVTSYLLGRTSEHGWWYYFPVAFLFKTSLGLHILLALTIAYAAVRLRSRAALTRLAHSSLRAPIVMLIVFGSVLLTSSLNIGFRYAMPLLPMVAVIAAVGATAVWRQNWRFARAAVVAATAWLVIHPLSYYPNFLTYISEYGPGRDRNYEVLVDSSMDWGQGLLQLRDFMRENGIPRVYLSYYGSGRPAAYGIDHVPLRSFLPLPDQPQTTSSDPQFVVISATNLAGGAYFAGEDPFRLFREREPAFVVGHMLYGFRLEP